jgi:hypothetical protein
MSIIHAPLEVTPAALCQFDISARDRLRVLAQDVKQDEQIPGAAVEDPVEPIPKMTTQLA